MVRTFTFDPQSFKGMEQAGWDRNAPTFGEIAGRTTGHAVASLLDAVGAGAGTRVLDVCCGTGLGAAAAAARGAAAIGVDFAPAMVGVARQSYPGAEFQQDDAEALGFADASFEAVICAFGLNHVSEPERAIAEAYRVLAPGGRYAFTVWCTPDKCPFFAAILGAVQTHGRLDVPLPPAPSIFRFSDPAECVAVLERAGFRDMEVTEIPIVVSRSDEDSNRTPELLYNGTVRMRMILELQTPEARERIHRAIADGVRPFRKNGKIEFPMPAVLASGRKP